MKVLLIFRFFSIYFGSFIVKIYVSFRKNDKVLASNVAHFPNFETSASL